MSRADALIALVATKTDLTLVPFKVASVAPLTVYLSGGSVAVSGKAETAIWSVGDTGLAIWSPTSGVPPLCFKTI